ncbi:isochorismatase family protein [Corticibacter populi]|uniref:Isochorismatase family protein n=1 Tax=Corticibacter populi TaxID=1550736 RepID=A0A3M6QZK0_9BURK|nr:isochorismatase family protein [Corticibacter populi]RMX08456.1 isochorismatase family protein [Corticibacter populi]RZS35765.1 bifunctional isochorismate lyase/aryl carrier protein [Corticibacter populi]
MALPTIASYPLPSQAELPMPRHAWQLQPSRAALLVHDMQQYFLAPYPQDAEPLRPVMAHVAALLAQCRAANIPVFYTAQKGNQERCDRGLQAVLWGPGMRATAEHEDIAPPLQPQQGDHVLVKHRYSAFQRSNLAQMLRVRGRDQLMICGVYAHIGCLLTAAEAFQQDIEPFLLADALADFSREQHLQALRWAAATGITPLLTMQALQALGADNAQPAQTNTPLSPSSSCN